ncbi:MAG: squalene/phytoene synthase family protein [Verrucomicrobiota bacterium]
MDRGRELEGILRDVSRSFFLSLKVLPNSVRGTLGLGYLLARLSDSVADSSSAAPGRRVALLRRLEESLRGGEDRALEGDLLSLRAKLAHPGEQRLLGAWARLRGLHRGQEAWVREKMEAMLSQIFRGQRLDVERFGDADRNHPVQLHSKVELTEYTVLVAGCVGEFWTDLCERCVPRYFVRGAEPMRERGRALGQGLQLINILRDLPEDLRQGRCYLPRETSSSWEGEVLWREAEPWRARCRGYLNRGGEYLAAVRPWRLRLAVGLPLALARKTLARLETAEWEEVERGIKVPRSELRRLLFLGMLRGWRE